MRPHQLLGLVGLLAKSTWAIELDITNTQNVKDVASTMAYGMLSRYTGNLTGDVPGNLPDPYHWWTTGAMFGALLDYWWITGDETYNNITMQALLHQASPSRDFMPENQTLTLGNDDQGFWAMAAMTAAENKFPDPPEGQPQWLALAQACFNQWVTRWDPSICGGGLRWQIFEFNKGFDYKNSISNGCFFNIAARLARYTGNETYAEWAEKIWDWQTQTGLISDKFEVFDGAHEQPAGEPCPPTDKNRWSYNAGIFLLGSAFMTNHTGDQKWLARTEGLLEAAESHYLVNDVIVEKICEGQAGERGCNIDQRTFKGYLIRWLHATSTIVPSLRERARKMIEPSAIAAAKSCTGNPVDQGFRGPAGTACGLDWTQGVFDGLWGVGEQMNSMSAVMYLLSDGSQIPVTNATGGTSGGDDNAGTGSHAWELADITTGDRAGAGILATLICAGLLGGVAWINYD